MESNEKYYVSYVKRYYSWCIFHTKYAFTYGAFSTKEEAEIECDKLNNKKRWNLK